MASTNELQVRLYDIHGRESCLADIILPQSNTEVCGFRVMAGTGKGLHVHMPPAMKCTWPYEEISWEQVRGQIKAAFLAAAPAPISVTFYDFNDKDDCLADITLNDTETVLTGFKIMHSVGGGIQVHMPPWMHSKWTYTDIEWSDVRRLVTERYLAAIAQTAAEAAEASREEPAPETEPETEQEAEQETEPELTPAPETEPVAAPAPLAADAVVIQPQDPETQPVITFYSERQKTEMLLDVVIRASGTRVNDIYLSVADGNVTVAMPYALQQQWTVEELPWEACAQLVEQEYRRRFEGDATLPPADSLDIGFKPSRRIYTCLVDIQFPQRKLMKGFMLRDDGSSTHIITPKWMGQWKNDTVTWSALCRMIRAAFYQKNGKVRHFANTYQTASTGVTESAQVSPAAVRHAALDGSFMQFSPRTVLRLSSTDNARAPKKKLHELAAALNKGINGGFGPFEINVLVWVAQLRYMTEDMLLDLIEYGHLSLGWRTHITEQSLAAALNEMERYDLIAFANFTTVDERGVASEQPFPVRVATLGRAGHTLLRELGKNVGNYDAFDVLQDGNTVKKVLVANQWLLYWLTTYKEQVGEDYEPSYILYRKGATYLGAKIHAMVTVNGRPMMVEPVRRVEDFEEEDFPRELRYKLERLCSLFGDLDHLYHINEEVSFPDRPIITLVCEDDEHMAAVWTMVEDIAASNPEQAIWLSCDRRILDPRLAGQRIGRFADGAFAAVDYVSALEIEAEPPAEEQ